ncbi:BTAD domain-containing putative transcriptional regulator [Micrococcus sp. TA1]|uniref:AfsR/SARP family transcriptional regulator n=1 Tax=Micrococcus sp. TA1 TaxID=681627 RepID=UPI0016089886|nr:BTAD domain-containing putative transcriptional regulator [Micrococcus sp. TA1]MBB5748494.1 DNA-binding SARP family transcriptional activator [Micrococcus sp. TA1]
MDTTFVVDAHRAPVPGAEQHLTITMLGALEVRRGDTVLGPHQLGGPKSRQVLEILLLHLGTPVSKGRLIELLWEGAPPAAAVSTLESYVSVLRRCLQPGRGRTGALKTTTGGYFLDTSMIDLDVTRFDALLRRAGLCPPAQAYPYLCEALSLASAPLLGSELLPEWAEAERRLQNARTAAAMVQAADTARELGLDSEAVAWSRRVLDSDELNEAAWTSMILALEQGGHPVSGLRAYERCRAVLARELGCSPGPVLQAAQERLLRATSASGDDFGRVIHALLTIQGVLEGEGPRDDRPALADPTDPTDTTDPTDRELILQDAGTVISGYLHRALPVSS